MTEQLGAVAHQLQHLFAQHGGAEVLKAQHADEFFLLQQGAIEARAHPCIGQIVVLAQHGLVGRLGKTQGFAGAQGANVATVTANGRKPLGAEGKDRGQLFAAEGAIGLIVPEDQAIGPQALLEGFQHGDELLLAGHLAQAWQLQGEIGDGLLALGLQADEPEGILFMGESDMPLLSGEAQHQLAPLTLGKGLLYGQSQGIRQLGRPGTSRFIQPMKRGLHHIGQGDQPLAAHIQTKEQRCLAGRGKVTERGRRHELITSC